jgi:hypothetical protein
LSNSNRRRDKSEGKSNNKDAGPETHNAIMLAHRQCAFISTPNI